MPIVTQLVQALLASPLIIVKGKSRFFLALFLYVGLGLIVFGGFSFLLIENQDEIRQAMMNYVLPQSWHSISDAIINFFWASQTKIVLASTIISGSMVVASIILFPIKEYCSSCFEAESGYDNGPKREFPLWLQGFEEGKLLALYITVQSVIFAIGYYPYDWCNWVSNTLSIAFLCFSFALDFIAPTLQRHRIRYSHIIKLLSKNIIATMLFGAVFSLPLLLFGQWVLRLESLTLAELTAVLFMINILLFAVAIPAGTHLASQLMPEAYALKQSKKSSKIFAYGFLAVLLVVGVTFHSLVAMSLHHKSQFLKCEYDIDLSSIDIDMPSLLSLAGGEREAKLSFDLRVTNPTEFDLMIEKSHLNIWQNDHLISRIQITELSVVSGDSIEQPMSFNMKLNTSLLSGFKGLMDGWVVQLEFDLLPGIPFVVKVL